MRIIIVTQVDVTIPGAVVSRLLAYARGISELGQSVNLFWLGNTQESMIKASNQYPKVNFQGFAARQYKGSKFLRLLMGLHHGYLAKIQIKKMHKIAPLDSLLYYGILIPERIPIQQVCNKLGIKTFDEITEFPFLGRQEKLIRKLQYKLFMEKYVVQDAGVLCISVGIAQFMKDHLLAKGINAPVSLFGILVETDKFRCKDETPHPTALSDDYIAYCGSMYGEKDGVQDLIRAFSITLQEIPDLKLVLIGDNSDSEKNHEIYHLIDILKIEGKVIFTGRIDWDLMHSYLCAAKALVLAKPLNKQNEGAFPTKLGEYLACGRPVITTKVGDIPLFLKDGVNAYMANPGDPDDFAAKIIECLSDRKKSEEIASNGRRTAVEVFSHKIRSQQLIDLLRQSNQR